MKLQGKTDDSSPRKKRRVLDSSNEPGEENISIIRREINILAADISGRPQQLDFPTTSR